MIQYDFRAFRRQRERMAMRGKLRSMIATPEMQYTARDDWRARIWIWAVRKWLSFDQQIHRP
jgi:hypothetical protein